MKKRTFLIGVVAGVLTPVSSFAGGCPGCATEMTQYANFGLLSARYAKQIDEYERQLMQYVTQTKKLQTMIQNLIANPISILGPEIGDIINGVGKIMSAGKSIGSTMAQVSDKFKTTFKIEFAGDYHDKFKKWHETSSDTLEGMMKASALHRERFESEADKLKALYTETQKTEGNLMALQTLSKVAIDQVQKLQQLGDLIASANLAAGTYMATENAEDEVMNANLEKITKNYKPEIKKHGVEKNTDWSSVILKK